MKKKSIFCLLAIFVVTTTIILLPMSLAASTESASPWMPPSNFIDPVTLKVQEFKAQGLSNAQILTQLDKLGMCWNPQTGDTQMKGMTLPPEIMKNLPAPPEPSFNTLNAQSNIGSRSERLDYDPEACETFGTPNNQSMGIYVTMIPGTMPVSADETHTHFNTQHLGKPWSNGTACYVEVGVAHYLVGGTEVGPVYYIYNRDATHTGEYTFCGDKTDLSASDNYGIRLNGTSDSNGWWYDVWINQVWKLRGHLLYQLNSADVSNEIFTDTGTFTGTTAAQWSYPWITDSSNNWIAWNYAISYSQIDWATYMGYSVIGNNPYEFWSWTK